MRTVLILLAALLALPESAGGQMGCEGATLQTVHNAFLQSVERSSGVQESEQLISCLRAGVEPQSPEATTLTAYQGALRTLRAKHGRWPPSRLRDLNEGLKLLDRAVAEQPELVEVRYLRLMSHFHLPSLFKRGRIIEEDIQALARQLPASHERLPSEWYGHATRFVLDNGVIPEHLRVELEESLNP